jgi:predicted XRE-type DNA-binding protein
MVFLLYVPFEHIKRRHAEAQELAREYEDTKTCCIRRRAGKRLRDSGRQSRRPTWARAQIGFHVCQILPGKKLKQREIADVLGIAQPDVSDLMNGHFSRFTTDKLLDFLKPRDRKVTIEVSPHREGQPYQQVTLAP